MNGDLIIICSAIVAILIIIYVIFSIKTKKFKNDLLVNHLGDRIEPNSFYEHELDDCYTNLTIRLFKKRKKKIYNHNGEYTESFIKYRDKVRKKIKPYIVESNMMHTKSFYPSLYFNSDFCNWVKSYHEDACVKDFYDVMIMYVLCKIKQLNMKITDANVDNYLIIQAEALSNDVKTMMLENCIENSLSKNVKIMYDDDNQIKIKRSEYIAAYNKCIGNIKSNNGIGLVPVITEHMQKSFYDYLCGLKVVSHQKLLKLNEDENFVDEKEGCYIIYNTYTGKYFVGKAKHPLNRAYLLLTRKVLSSSVLLSYEFSLGNMMLIKIVPLEGSGYMTLSDLQKALVRAYNSLNPYGYNKPCK